MNQEENTERDEREERHTGTQRDIKSIRLQIDRLTGEVGKLVVGQTEMVTAIKGNDMGTEGIVNQVLEFKKELKELKERVDNMELAAKKKEMYIVAFFAACGVVLGTIIKTVIDHAFKK